MEFFHFTITAGDVAIILSAVIAFLRWDRKLAKYMVEHEMLMNDFCERKHITLGELPTRSKRPF